MKKGKGSCHGTFGELVQGIINERPFLITLPIPSLHCKASFIPIPTSSEIKVADTKGKAQKVCQLLFQQFGLQGGGFLDICSNIPIGKGMASSTADIVASLRAIGDSFALPLSNEMISAIAAKVEPTDGIMYKEVVAYDYLHGELIESLGVLPPFILAGIDLGGVIDTVEFNRIEKAYNQHDHDCFLEAYYGVREGIKKQNLSLIFKAATISARINQKILPKPFFPEFEKLAHDCHGGIVVAHSGTMVGILIDPYRPNRDQVVLHVSRELAIIAKKLGGRTFYYSSNEKNDNVLHFIR